MSRFDLRKRLKAFWDGFKTDKSDKVKYVYAMNEKIVVGQVINPDWNDLEWEWHGDDSDEESNKQHTSTSHVWHIVMDVKYLSELGNTINGEPYKQVWGFPDPWDEFTIEGDELIIAHPVDGTLEDTGFFGSADYDECVDIESSYLLFNLADGIDSDWVKEIRLMDYRKTPEHSLSSKQEESEKYLTMLNNMVCIIWTQYELTKDITLPRCLNSKNEDGSVNVSYPGSCMYKIDWTGKTVCKEFPNEDLDISSLEILCVVAATIVKDITGDHSCYDEIWSVLIYHLKNQMEQKEIRKGI